MKRILGISFLLSILPWLASAAAIDPTAAALIAHGCSSNGEYSTQIRAQIIFKVFPKTVEFLIRSYSDQIRKAIPDFGTSSHQFAICDKTSTSVIIPSRAHPFDRSVRGEIIVWDLKENKLIRHVTGIPLQIKDVLVTPDGNKIITVSGDSHASIWNINGDRELHNLGDGGTIALNQDGSQLVTASWDERAFKEWDVETGRQLHQISNKNTTCPWGSCKPFLAVSPDGTKVAIIGHKIYVFDLITGRTLFKLDAGHDQRDDYAPRFAYALTFSPDGTQLIGDLFSPFRLQNTYCKTIWSMRTGDQISHEEYGDTFKYVRGNRRSEFKDQLDTNDLINIFDETTGQLLCSINTYNHIYTFTDRWLVWQDERDKKTYSLDLCKMAAFYHVIASLSDRQLWLLKHIRNKAEHDNIFVLDGDNPKLAGLIEDFVMLPESIKDLVQEYVTFGAYE